MGDGDNTFDINVLTDNSSFSAGTGSDTGRVGRLSTTAMVTLGDGNDTLAVDDVSSRYDEGRVSMGDEDDQLTLRDSLSGTTPIFDGGAGEDSLALPEVSVEAWNGDIELLFGGFENVELSDARL